MYLPRYHKYTGIQYTYVALEKFKCMTLKYMYMKLALVLTVESEGFSSIGKYLSMA